MRHPLDRPVASDFSYELLQQRRSVPQLTAAEFDNRRCDLNIIPGHSPRVFIADVDAESDTAVEASSVGFGKKA